MLDRILVENCSEIAIEVDPGETVSSRDTVWGLEAMKRENDVVAQMDGTLVTVPLSENTSVDMSEPPVTFE